MDKDTKLILMVGVTGKCGYYALKDFLKLGYKVRILTRNRNATKKVLGDLFDQIEDVVECDLYLESKTLADKIPKGYTESILKFAFEPTNG